MREQWQPRQKAEQRRDVHEQRQRDCQPEDWNRDDVVSNTPIVVPVFHRVIGSRRGPVGVNGVQLPQCTFISKCRRDPLSGR